ncbi:hypothetical protein Pcinc_013108 [Petrolisthes cinctipes]|uniref:Uncharacterized protein n=1 Tax=Petrolisthes cinctipes TaxID=88211 RepID=A0AAE1KRX4_PETCI|nr:hypothetical protein Pcinc_013108 [Petrolisthes cinctipes]
MLTPPYQQTATHASVHPSPTPSPHSFPQPRPHHTTAYHSYPCHNNTHGHTTLPHHSLTHTIHHSYPHCQTRLTNINTPLPHHHIARQQHVPSHLPPTLPHHYNKPNLLLRPYIHPYHVFLPLPKLHLTPFTPNFHQKHAHCPLPTPHLTTSTFTP